MCAILVLAGCGEPDGEVAYDLAALVAEARVISELERLDFGTADTRSYLDEGWSRDESAADGTSFVWSTGESSSLRLFFSEQRDVQLNFRCWRFQYPEAPPQQVTVEVNGATIATVALAGGPAEYRVHVPASVVESGNNRVSFRYRWHRAPRDVIPGATDGRGLAVAWDWLSIDNAFLAQTPSVEDDTLTVPFHTRVEYLLMLPAESVLLIDHIALVPARDEVAGMGLAVTLDTLKGRREDFVAIEGDGPFEIALIDAREPQLALVSLQARARAPTSSGGLRLTKPRVRREGPSGIVAAARERTTKRPHILLYVADTLRADHLGTYGYGGGYGGHGESPSPSLDDFAEDATVFTRAFAQSSWTKSSMASIFSGLTPERHGTNGRDSALPSALVTLSEQLKDLGYDTLWGNPVLVDRSTRPAMPSIVLVSVDCLRADHLSAYGYPRETSPYIDAFSREAVLFETAIAASTYTLPTHASMLTGLPPSLHGANVSRGISPSVAYVPESLVGAGYRVSAVVSAAFLSQTYGFHRGFHSYRVDGGRAASIIDRALAVLDEGEGQAQFLFLHLYDVHAPYTAPTEFIDRFLEPEADVTESLRVMTPNARAPNDAELQRVIALYDAEIAYVDQEIGRFLDELKARGLFDTSLIIITADHGEAFQEHGAWRHGRALALDKPGLYDEIVHIPLIVKWPGEMTGVEIASVVSQMDVSATILEAAGIESSSAWSLGLRRHIDDGGNVSTRSVIAEAVTRDPKRGASLQIALRDERSKYIASFRASTLSELYETGPIKEEFYDLQSDPLEQSNLQADPGVSPGSFRTALQSYLERVRESPPVDGEDVTLDEALLEKLRALGYLDP